MKTAVIYRSKYGSTQRYAQWLARALHADLLELQEVSREQLAGYEALLYGGGIYAGSIEGLKRFRSVAPRGRSIAILAVGAAPESAEALEQLRRFLEEEEMLFHLRGALTYGRMTVMDRLLMRMMRGMVAKKSPRERAAWERELLEGFGQDVDWTNEAAIAPIVETLRNQGWDGR